MYSVEVPGIGIVKSLSPMTVEEVQAQFRWVAAAAEADVREQDEIEMNTHKR